LRRAFVPFNFSGDGSDVDVFRWPSPAATPSCSKPSEKVPLTAVRLAEIIPASRVARGRLQNLIQGGARSGRHPSCSHPKVAAISFLSASSPVGAGTCTRLGGANGKRVQAAGRREKKRNCWSCPTPIRIPR